MFKKPEFITIFIIMVTEVLGFSLILPFLPFYIEDLGGNALTVGLILTTFSLFQFFSAPILGKLSDHYGRKPLLIISQISTLISFIVLGFAKTIPLIFLSRIIDGAFGSNFTIAQSYLSDISSEKDRTKAFGISGAAFGFGFLIGPAIGGGLAKISFALPAFTAAGFSLITILLTTLLLKETVTSKKGVKLDSNFIFNQVTDEINPKKIFDKLTDEKLGKYLIIFFFYIFSHTVFISNFALFGKRQIGLTVDNTGYILAYVGLISITLRGLLLPFLIDRFKESALIKNGYYFEIFALIILASAKNIPLFLLGITFFSLGNGLLRPTLVAKISRLAPKDQQGHALGTTNSLGSIAQIIGPISGGYALKNFLPAILPIFALISIGISYLQNKSLNQR